MRQKLSASWLATTDDDADTCDNDGAGGSDGWWRGAKGGDGMGQVV